MITNNIESVAALDIGNSRVKLLTGNKTAYSFSYELIDDLYDIINNSKQNRLKIYYSSVNPEKLEIIKARFKSDKRISFYSAFKTLQSKEIINFSLIKGMGEDRLLGLCGAAFKYEPPLATIDCGTAITINFLDKNKNVLGGTIFPGMQTQADALNFYTSRLPELSYKTITKSIGKNTNDAILAGIRNSAFGGIKETIMRAKENFFKNEEIKFIFTGGAGSDMFKMMKKEVSNVYFEEYLVLKGILSLIPWF